MKPRHNTYLSSICESTGEVDPLRAIAKYVSPYRKPGMTLEVLAGKLGVSAIVEEGLPFDGGVFAEGTKLTIKINSSSIPVRKRFTLAHELGHLIISGNDARSARRCLTSNPLEMACDLVAAELLMPVDEVLGAFEGRASVATLRLFADRFKVSLQAAAVRLRELKLWRESVGFWKWNGSAERLWYLGRRFWTDDQVLSPAFEQAMGRTSPIETDVQCNGSSGIGIRRIPVKLQKLGKQYIVGLISVPTAK